MGLSNWLQNLFNTREQSADRLQHQAKQADELQLFVTRLEDRRVLNAAGALDVTFANGGADGDGVLISDFGNGENDRFTDIGIDNLDRIVTVGTAVETDDSGNDDVRINRFLSDGTLDTSFGDMGTLIVDIGGQEEDDLGNALVIDLSDNSIYVAGTTEANGTEDFFVLHVNADGTVDTNFGTGGSSIVDFGTSGRDRGFGIDLQIDNGNVTGIFAVGEARTGANRDIAIAKLGTDGQLDTNFSVDGLFANDIGASGNADLLTDVFVDSSTNQLFAVGQSNGDALAVSINANDGTGFASNTVDAGGNEQIAAVAQTGSGFVAVGLTTVNGNDDVLAIGFQNDLSADTNFGTAGVVITALDPTFADSAADVVVQADGRIIAAGSVTNNASALNDFALVRYAADGTLDTSFGTNGIVMQDLGNGDNDVVTSAALQSTGRLIVAGRTDSMANGNTESALAGFLTTPAPISFEVNGTTLEIEDLAGLDNNLRLGLEGGEFVLFNLTTSTEVNRVAQGSIAAISVNLAAGDDRLTLDESLIDANLTVTYNGGSEGAIGDLLTFSSGTVDSVVHQFDNANDGSVQVDRAGGSLSVSYFGLEPINDNLSATDRVFNFTGAAETITLSDDLNSSAGISFIDSSLGESVTFVNPTASLTINTELAGGSGIDTINVAGLDAAFTANLLIDAGTDDTLNFQTTATNLNGGNLTADAQSINVTTAVSTTGAGTIDLTADRNIAINSSGSLSTVDGTLTLLANGVGGGNFVGVSVAGAIQTTDGSVDVTGTGGDAGDGNVGVLVSGPTAQVSASGNGNVSITGFGGNGQQVNDGIFVNLGGLVAAAGSGTVTLTGTGGNGTNLNHGVHLRNAATTVSTENGLLTVTGVASGTGANNDGVFLVDDATLTTTGTGNLVVNGTAGNEGDDARIEEEISTGGSQTYNANVALDDGTAGVGTIGFTGTDIAFNAGVSGTESLRLSHTGTATFAVGTTSTYTGTTTLVSGLTAVNGVIDNSGGTVTVQTGATLGGDGTVNRDVVVQAGGSVAPGNSPGILNTGNFTLGAGTLTIEVDGLAGAGVDPNGHDQLNVTGTVDLTGGTLELVDNFAGTAAAGTTLTILDNDNNPGADAVTGVFATLVGGTDFNGGTLAEGDAFSFNDQFWQISYVGGDGNDVSLTVLDVDLTRIYVNDDFIAANNFVNGQVITDADPNTALDQPAIVGVTAFATIQAGVDAVDAGGTVFITDTDTDGDGFGGPVLGDGVYEEAVLIDKSLTLTGTSGNAADVVIASPAGAVPIEITNAAGDVTLDSLTAAANGQIALTSRTTGHLVITNVVADNNNRGMFIDDAASVTVADSSISGNADFGIRLVSVAGAVNLTNVMADNNFTDNLIAINVGSLTVAGGSFSGSLFAGILVSGNSGAIQLTNVTADDNGDDGLRVNGTGANAVTITGGTFDNNGDIFLGGDGIDLRNVGDVIFTGGVQAVGNDPGVLINTAASFSDTDGNFTGNDDHGIRLIDIAGDVTLVRTTLNDNDANNDGTGDGLNATDGADVDDVAIGGNLLVQGATITSTNPGTTFQQTGISVDGVAGNATFEDSTGVVQSVTVTGNNLTGIELTDVAGIVSLTNVTADSNDDGGLFVLGAGAVTVTQGSYSTNNNTGLNIQDVTGTVTLDNVTADGNTGTAFGAFIGNASDVSVTAGSYSNNSSHGLALGNITGTATLTNAAATGNAEDGLNVQTAGTLVVSGGTYTSNTESGLDLLDVGDATLNNIDVSGNTLNSVLDTVTTVNFVTSAGTTEDQVDINTASVNDEGNFRLTRDPNGTPDVQDIFTYVAVTTLNVNTGDGADTVNVVPHSTTEINLDGGDPTTTPGDTVNIFTATPATTTTTTTGATTSITGMFGTLTHTNFEETGLQGAIVFNGSGNDDTLTINATGGDSATYVLTTDGTIVDAGTLTGVTSLTFNGLLGNDILVIDHSGSGSLFNPTGGIIYDGGTGGENATGTNPEGDSLELLGGTASGVEHVFVNENDGFVLYNGTLVGTPNVSYTGLEPVLDTITATTRTFTFTGGAETITLTDDATPGQMTIDSTLGELVVFTNPTDSLTINAGSGDDTINITSVDATYRAALTVDGGANNDTVNLNAALTLGNSASATDTGNLTVTGETINVNANIATTADGTAGNVSLTGTTITQAGGVAIDTTGAPTGNASLTADRIIVLNTGSSITASNGDVVLNAGTGPTLPNDNFTAITIDGATVATTGTGNIDVVGVGVAVGANTGTSGNGGVLVTLGGLVEASGSGAVDVTGTGGAGQAANDGVRVTGLGAIRAAGGGVTVVGSGGSNGTAASDSNFGVIAANGVIEDIGTGAAAGAVIITGIGGAGAFNNTGVFVSGTGAIRAAGGGVTVVGNGGSNGNAGNSSNSGVVVQTGAVIEDTGIDADTGAVNITGTGGAGGVNNEGVLVASSGTAVRTAGGDLTIAGTGGGSGLQNEGVEVVFGGSISAAGTGTVTITGLAGGTTTEDVLIDGSTFISTVQSVSGDITITGLQNDVSMTNGGRVLSNSGNAILRAAENVLLGTVNLDNDGLTTAGAGSAIITADFDTTPVDAINGVASDGVGAITDNLVAETANITAAQVALRAATGIGNDTSTLGDAGDIDVQASSLVNATNSTSGAVQIFGHGGLPVGLIQNIGRTVVLDTDAAMFDATVGDTLADVTAGTVILNAATGIGFDPANAGDDVALELVDATSVTATTTNGNIDIDNDVTAVASPVIVNSLTTGTGNISYDQTGNQSLTLTAVSAANGNVNITNSGGTDADINIVSVTADTTDDTVTLLAEGAIFAAANTPAAVEIAAANIVLTANNGGIGQNGNPFDIDATASFSADTTTDNGNITVNDIVGDLPIGLINAGTGTVTLTADTINDATENPDLVIDITAGTVDLNAVNGIGSTAHVDLAVINITADTTNGNIVLNNTTTANATVNSLTTGNNTAGASITFAQSGGGDVIFAGPVASGVGVNGGNITLTSTAGLTVSGTVSSANGVGGTLTIGGANIAGTVTVGAGNISITGGAFDTFVDAPLSAGAGGIRVEALRDVFVRNTITTTAGGNIELVADTDGIANVGQAAGTDNEFAEDGGMAEINALGGVRVEAAGLVNSSGNVLIQGSDLGITETLVESVDIEADTVAGTNQVIAAGTITIESGPNAPANADILINGRVESTSTSIAPAAAPITITAAQDVRFDTTGNAATNNGSLNTPGLVVVTATSGAIVDDDLTDETADIVASQVALQAATGIGADGTNGEDIDTAVFPAGTTLTLAAVTETGDIHVTHTGNLTVGTAGTLVGVTILDTVDDNITLTADNGDLTVNSAIENRDGGDINLRTAAAGDITINADVQVTGDVAGTNNDGQIIVTADTGNITHNTGTVSTVGGESTSNSGRIQYNAGEIIRVGDSSTTNAAAVIRSVNGNIEMTAAPTVAITSNGTAITIADEAPTALNEAIIETLSGNVRITGTGISDGTTSNNVGVLIASGSVVRSIGIESTNELGTITISGDGGAGEDNNDGVRIESIGTMVTSVDANITITGTGGSNGLLGSSENRGVIITTGAVVSSTGVDGLERTAALITVNGMGGMGEDRNVGVIIDRNSHVVSVDGDISMAGTGGSNGMAGSDRNLGVDISFGGMVSSTGTDTIDRTAALISVNGTGGAGEDENDGVSITVFAQLTSVDGDILISGTGDSIGTTSSVGNDGVIIGGSTRVSSTGVDGLGQTAALVTIIGTAGLGNSSNNGVTLASDSEVSSVDGDILISGTGGSVGGTGSRQNRGVFLANRATVKSSGIDSATQTAALITIDGRGGDGEVQNSGIDVSNSIITSVDGDISISGTGGSSGASTNLQNTGVEFDSGSVVSSTGNGSIDRSAALITINGIGGSGGSLNAGVLISSADTLVTSVIGDIAINGAGGQSIGAAASGNNGVIVNQGAVVSSTGIEAVDRSVALVTIEGTGGTGSVSNSGVVIANNNTLITSVDGDIAITGFADISPTGSANRGVHIEIGATVSSTGIDDIGRTAALVTITGTGAGENDGDGVRIRTAKVASVDGNITITGTSNATGSRNDGVEISGRALVESTRDAEITVVGIGTINSVGNFNHGVSHSDSVIRSFDGDTIIVGAGGAGTEQIQGVIINNDARVDITGLADVIINGTAGANTEEGIRIDAGARVGDTNNNGDGSGFIILDANNDELFLGRDTVIRTNAVVPSVGGMNPVDNATRIILSADDIEIEQPVGGNDPLVQVISQNNGIGEIVVAADDGNRAINLGFDANLQAANTLRLDEFELNQLEAQIVRIGNFDIDSPAFTGATLGHMGNVPRLINQNDDPLVVGATADLARPFASATMADITIVGVFTADSPFATDLFQLRTAANVAINADVDLATNNPGRHFEVFAGTNITQGNNAAVLTGSVMDDKAVISVLPDTLVRDGDVQYIARRSITMNPDSSITTLNGEVSLLANQQAVPTGGMFNGITLNRATITTGIAGPANMGGERGGDILLKGLGGDTGSSNDGVRIENQSLVQSVGSDQVLPVFTEAGSITIIGTSTQTTSNGSGDNGVVISTSTVTSRDGDIAIEGTGGRTASLANNSGGNQGILLNSSRIISTGTDGDSMSGGTFSTAANITLTGTAGNGTSFNIGIRVNPSSQITTVDGDILLTGTGDSNEEAGSQNNHGIEIAGSSILSTGSGPSLSDPTRTAAGTITLLGVAGNGESDNDGVKMLASDIRTVDGAVRIEGTGGANPLLANSGNNDGVSNFSGIVVSTGTFVDGNTNQSTGSITIVGQGGTGQERNRGVFLDGGNVSSFSANISITGTGGDRGVNGVGTGSNNHGVQIQSGHVVGGAITITGNAANVDTLNDNIGILIEEGNSNRRPRVATGSRGDITLIGAGHGAGEGNHGVAILSGGSIESTGLNGMIPAANISIVGTATTELRPGTNNNQGVFISGNATNLGGNGGTLFSEVTAVYGLIDIDGVSNATGENNRGVLMNDGGRVVSTGTDRIGNPLGIDITGTGGNGTNGNDGVEIASGNSMVSSVDGDVIITGTGRGNGNNNHGMEILDGASVTSTGTDMDAATIAIDGTGNGVDDNEGVLIQNTGTLVTSVNGAISITGDTNGTGDDNEGVEVSDGAVVSSTGSGADAATITIDGIGNGANGNQGVLISETSTLVSSEDGDILIEGRSTGTGSSNSGVEVLNGAQILSTGTSNEAADISIDGVGSTNGVDANHGVLISGAGERTQDLIVNGGFETGDLTGWSFSNPQLFNGGFTINNGTANPFNSPQLPLPPIAGNFDAIAVQQNPGGRRSLSQTVTLPENIVSATAFYKRRVLTPETGLNGTESIEFRAGATFFDTVTFGIDGVVFTGRDVTRFVQNRGGSDISIGIALRSSGNILNAAIDDVRFLVTSRDVPTEITAANGTISITGEGNGSGSENEGVEVSDTAAVTSQTGSISIEGQGNGIASNEGVLIQDVGTMVNTDSGTIDITGDSFGRGDGNEGVEIAGGANVQSNTTGDVTIVGTAGSETQQGVDDNEGVLITGIGSLVSTVSGNLTVTGESFGTGDRNEGVDIGGNTSDAANRLAFGGAVVHSSGGTMRVSGNGNIPADTASGSGNRGVIVQGTNARVRNNGGSLSIVGIGADGIDDNTGVMVTNSAQITNDDANITIDGTGGTNSTASGDRNEGVRIDLNGDVINVGSGALDIKGTGLGNNGNTGVAITGFGTTVQVDSGLLSIDGKTSGTGNENRGVMVANSAAVKSENGNVDITGASNSSMATANSQGVLITESAAVTTMGSSVTIDGESAATGGFNNEGVEISLGARVETTASGAINITGTDTTTTGNLAGDNDDNVQISDAILRTNSGDIKITGTNADVRMDSNGRVLTDEGVVTVTAGRHVHLDSVNLNEDNAGAMGLGQFIADTTDTGTGAIFDNRMTEAPNVMGGQAVFVATSGVGTPFDDIDTSIPGVEAFTFTGGIHLDNDSLNGAPLVIGNVPAPEADRGTTGLMASGGDIVVNTASSVIVAQQVTNAGAFGSITLDAEGAGSSYTGNAAVQTTGAGDITMTAGSNVTTNAVVLAMGAGSINANAGSDVTTNAMVQAMGGGSINANAGDDFINNAEVRADLGGSIDIVAGSDLTVNADMRVTEDGQVNGIAQAGVARIVNGATVSSGTGTVRQVAPVIDGVQTPQISALGEAILTFDLGVSGETNFTYIIEWADGTIDIHGTPGPQLNAVLAGVPGNSIATDNRGTVISAGRQEVNHFYTSPVNPNDPSAPIDFRFVVFNDPNINFASSFSAPGQQSNVQSARDAIIQTRSESTSILVNDIVQGLIDGTAGNGSNLELVATSVSVTGEIGQFLVPGEGFGASVFDLSPTPPELFAQINSTPILVDGSTNLALDDGNEEGFATGAQDDTVREERKIVLRILSPKGQLIAEFTISEDDLANLTALWARFGEADGRYQIVIIEGGATEVVYRDVQLIGGKVVERYQQNRSAVPAAKPEVVPADDGAASSAGDGDATEDVSPIAPEDGTGSAALDNHQHRSDGEHDADALWANYQSKSRASRRLLQTGVDADGESLVAAGAGLLATGGVAQGLRAARQAESDADPLANFNRKQASHAARLRRRLRKG